MNPSSAASIRKTMEGESTENLRKIYTEHDESLWSPEVLKVISQILSERGETSTLPPDLLAEQESVINWKLIFILVGLEIARRLAVIFGFPDLLGLLASLILFIFSVYFVALSTRVFAFQVGFLVGFLGTFPIYFIQLVLLTNYPSINPQLAKSYENLHNPGDVAELILVYVIFGVVGGLTCGFFSWITAKRVHPPR